MSALAFGCRILLGVLFALAASSKLGSRASFADFTGSLAGFGLPPSLVRRPVAAGIVGLEAVCAALLFAGHPVGDLLALGLLLGFTAGVVRVLRTGIPVSCRCFDASDIPIDASHLARNLFLLVVAAVGAAAGQLAPDVARPWLAGAVGAGLGAALTRWNDALFLIRAPLLPAPSHGEDP